MIESNNKILADILARMIKTDFKSFDLCDIKELPYFLWIYKSFHGTSLGKYVLWPHQLVLEKIPGTIRKLSGIKPQAYAQAHAFFARGLCLEYKRSGDKSKLDIATQLGDWILSNRSSRSERMSWGQPYDWYSRKIIRAHTPRTTVTSQVIQTLLDLYEYTDQQRFGDGALSGCQFLQNEMPRSFDSSGRKCLSYTTDDVLQVHNANMMAANALIRSAVVLSDDSLLDFGSELLAFTVEDQNDDGSWRYFKGKMSKNIIDNYHTGYVLESLIESKNNLSKFPYDEHLRSGIDFYCSQLFGKDRIPHKVPGKIYPIDIQSCAQSIITFTKLSKWNPEYRDWAQSILKFAREKMYDDAGYFYYRIYKDRIDKNSYIRWGDSWMYYAMNLFSNSFIGSND